MYRLLQPLPPVKLVLGAPLNVASERRLEVFREGTKRKFVEFFDVGGLAGWRTFAPWNGLLVRRRRQSHSAVRAKVSNGPKT